MSAGEAGRYLRHYVASRQLGFAVLVNVRIFGNDANDVSVETIQLRFVVIDLVGPFIVAIAKKIGIDAARLAIGIAQITFCCVLVRLAIIAFIIACNIFGNKSTDIAIDAELCCCLGKFAVIAGFISGKEAADVVVETTYSTAVWPLQVFIFDHDGLRFSIINVCVFISDHDGLQFAIITAVIFGVTFGKEAADVAVETDYSTIPVRPLHIIFNHNGLRLAIITVCVCDRDRLGFAIIAAAVIFSITS